MENLNIKSQKLRIRSNFLTFVEKVVVKPTEKWALCELITDYVPQFRKDQANEYSGDSLISLTTKTLYNFKYKPKTFYITLDPFYLDFIFLLTVDDLRSLIISQSDISEGVVFEEDEDLHHPRLGSTTLIFSTGEEYSTKSKLNDPTEAKRTLKFNSIMVCFNSGTVLGMKKAFYFSAEDAFRSRSGMKRLFTGKYHTMMNRVSKVLENINQVNWDYLKKSLLISYHKLVHGNFEIKKPMGVEKVVKEVEPQNPIDKIIQENHKQSKKRGTFLGVGKKMLRTTSNLKQVFDQIQSQKSLNPLAPSDTLPLESNPQPLPYPNKVSVIEEDKGEYDSETKLTAENLRSTFSLPKQGTLVGSIIPSRKQKESQESGFRKNATNIEKSSTIAINFDKSKPKPKDKDPIMASIIQKAQRMKTAGKITLESPTKDNQGKLLIPDSLNKLSRNGTSGSPSNRQVVLDTRLNTVDEKLLKKYTTNISITPSSDHSTPVKEENDFFFNNQSAIHSQVTRERTKNLDKSILSKRDPTSKSPNREKDDNTRLILQALQPKQKEIRSEGVHARKSIVFPMQARRFDTSKHMRSAASGNQSPIMKHKPTPRKHDDEKGLENYLFNAVYYNQYFELKEIMVLYPKNILGVLDEELNTLLIAAAQVGHKDIVQLFLNLGYDLDAQNAQGNTALHVALAYHHYDVGDLLVKHGAKQNITNARGRTAWEQ